MRVVLCIVLFLAGLLCPGCGPNMGAVKTSYIYDAAKKKQCKCGELDNGICMQCPGGVDNSKK